MKKRQKITIKPNKPKIQIKGFDSPGSGVSEEKRKPKPGFPKVPATFSQTIRIYLDNRYILVGLLIFFGLLMTLLIAAFFNKKVQIEPALPATPAVIALQPIDKELEEILSQETDIKVVMDKLISEKGYKENITILDTDIMLKDILLKERLPDPIYNELIYLAKRKKINLLEAKKTWYEIESPYGKDIREKLFVYEFSPSQSYLIMVLPQPDIVLYTKAESIKTKAVAGLIKTYLLDAVLENGGDFRIVEKIEDALKWVIDLYHVKPNDRFKLIYEEKWVDEKVVDVGKLLAISFQTNDKRYQAFYFKDGNTEGYFDKGGKSMKRKFLKSPVKYDRVTSAYNPERIHPVTGELKAHKGTDYYAEKGDPVFAVADGIIGIASQTTNNGNYIKIRHDDVYQTQYLHLMEGMPFAEGIKKGVKVKQGQVIGYAGRTGLTTGVHVCFRFWKNNKQVDPRYEEVVHAERPELMDIGAFLKNRDSLLLHLEEMTFF